MSSTLDTSASSLASALLHLVPSHDQLLEVDGAKLHINLDYSVGSFPWARLSLNGQNYQEEQAPVRRKRPCTPTDTSPGIMQGNESLTTPVAPSPDDWTAGGASQISENVCSTHMASKEEPHLRLAGGVDEFTNCKRRFRSPSSRLLGLTPVFSSLNGSSGAATQHAMSSLRASTVPSPPRISPTSVPDEPSWYSFGTEATTQGAWRDQSDSSSHLRIGSRDDLNPGYHLPSQSQQSNLSGMHSQSSWLGLYGLTARSSTPSLFNREHVEAASAVHGVSLQSAHTIGPFRSIQPPTACKPKGLSDTETSPRSMPITELTPPLSSPRLLYGSMQSSVSLSSPLGTSGSRLGNSFVYPDPMSFQAASHGRTKAFPTNESSQQVAYTYENTRATAMGQPWTLSNSQDGTEHSSAPVTPTLHQADCKSMRLRNMLSPRDGYASDIDERDDHRDSDSAMTSPYAILAQSNGQSYFAHPWGSTQQSLLGYSDTSPSKSIGSLSKSSSMSSSYRDMNPSSSSRVFGPASPPPFAYVNRPAGMTYIGNNSAGMPTLSRAHTPGSIGTGMDSVDERAQEYGSASQVSSAGTASSYFGGQSFGMSEATAMTSPAASAMFSQQDATDRGAGEHWWKVDDPHAELRKLVPKEKRKLLERPKANYITLLRLIILASPNRRLTLTEIYHCIETYWPYFRQVASPASVRNSIRNALSLNQAFESMPRAPDEDGKGGYWVVNESVEPLTVRRKTAKKRKAPSS